MNISEVRDRIAQGWTFREATMGKDWQARYPYIADWQGAFSVSCHRIHGAQQTVCKVSLMAVSGCPFHAHSHTTYILMETESSEPDRHRVVDDAIQCWNEENGGAAILRFKNGWMGEAGWEDRYPFIASWIRGGKRHCIQVRINLVTGRSSVKAWLYDSSTNTETVLFQQEFENQSEPEILERLDEGIKRWLREHEDV